MKLLRWDDRATRDVSEIYEYLGERNPGGARRVRRAIRQQAQLLADYPQLGRAGKTADTRELMIARTPYIVA